jgi:hypothetical protein
MHRFSEMEAALLLYGVEGEKFEEVSRWLSQLVSTLGTCHRQVQAVIAQQWQRSIATVTR